MNVVETLKNVDWNTVGALGMTVVGTIVTVLLWFKRNIANIKQLKEDSLEVSTEIKTNKAILKNQNDLSSEFGRLKKEYIELKKEIKELKMLLIETKKEVTHVNAIQQNIHQE